MKAQQLLLKFFQQLPRYTNLFSATVAIESLSLSSLTVTAVTSTEHGLTTGKVINITGAVIKNPLISLERVGNIVTGITEFDHDLTEGFNFDVVIEGAEETQYNGTYPLLEVPNRRTFTYQIDETPATPATGDIFLVEINRSVNPYNGLKTVTVIDETTFTYTVDQAVYSPPQGTMLAHTSIRVGGVLSYDKAAEWYSAQNSGKYWLFVTLGGRTASKDRYALDDATATTAIGTRFRQRVITPFSCFVFAPLQDDESPEGVNGRAVRDSMEDVFYFLCKSILRSRFQTAFTEPVWSRVAFVSHDFFAYNQAVYVHQFNFESTFDITFYDTIEPDDNVAFRDLTFDFKNENDIIVSHAELNLDDVPL